MDDAMRYNIALTQLPGVGPVLAKALLDQLGSARAVFSVDARALTQTPGVGPALARNILNARTKALQGADRELAFLAGQEEARPIFYQDPDYPQRLRHCPDGPILLYYRGNVDLNVQRVVGIVGTRRPTDYGRGLAEKVVAELRPFAPTVVSGLAYGVDALVHRACLQHAMPTIGVLGSGLGKVYPHKHRGLARRMSRQGGLVTEFISRQGPEREHFPMRNRIVAGLCDALLVVATGRRGGSMISAEFANSYHRDVFALPGRVDDPGAAGCHWLIKTHRAGLVESGEDLAYRMGWEEEERGPGGQPALFDPLTEVERDIARFIQQEGTAHIDHIRRKFGAQGHRLAACLLNLECQGVIRSLPGRRYTRKV